MFRMMSESKQPVPNSTIFVILNGQTEIFKLRHTMVTEASGWMLLLTLICPTSHICLVKIMVEIVMSVLYLKMSFIVIYVYELPTVYIYSILH